MTKEDNAYLYLPAYAQALEKPSVQKDDVSTDNGQSPGVDTTLDACIQWVSENCGTMNANRMAREMAAQRTSDATPVDQVTDTCDDSPWHGVTMKRYPTSERASVEEALDAQLAVNPLGQAINDAMAAESAKRGQCFHTSLSYGSGHYYILCDNCPARWVYSRLDSDVGDASPTAARVLDDAPRPGEASLDKKFARVAYRAALEEILDLCHPLDDDPCPYCHYPYGYKVARDGKHPERCPIVIADDALNAQRSEAASTDLRHCLECSKETVTTMTIPACAGCVAAVRALCQPFDPATGDLMPDPKRGSAEDQGEPDWVVDAGAYQRRERGSFKEPVVLLENRLGLNKEMMAPAVERAKAVLAAMASPNACVDETEARIRSGSDAGLAEVRLRRLVDEFVTDLRPFFTATATPSSCKADPTWARIQGEQIASLLDEARAETRRETIEGCAKLFERPEVWLYGYQSAEIARRIRALPFTRPAPGDAPKGEP